MSARSRLQASMEALARKKQREFDEHSKWSNQIQYYKNWDRHNNQYQSWTSPRCYESSISQYDALKKKENKCKQLQARREKLRKLFFEEEQQYELEISQSPRNVRQLHPKFNETPAAVLKEINVGLKTTEEDRKRHEAELNLYHKWRSENPIVRDYESNQNRASLKLAWLDRQIEKRMEQEKTEEETRKMIAERERLVKEEEEIDKFEREQNTKKEQEIMNQIQLQIQHYKIKDEEADLLKKEEEKTLGKKKHLEELFERRNDEVKRRRQVEMSLYNICQAKMKLRKQANEIEEQLRNDRKIAEDIIASQIAEEVQNEEQKLRVKEDIGHFLKAVRDQQYLEEQRQKFISFIFDSEAKNMWEKQEKLWREEQHARDVLLENVLQGIKTQIQEKIDKNLSEQRALIAAREEALKEIEQTENEILVAKEEREKRKIERKMEIDKQIQDKHVAEKERKIQEERKKHEELENIRKEEERLRNELMKMQRRQYPPRLNRRIIW